jgi:hypothetical protein
MTHFNKDRLALIAAIAHDALRDEYLIKGIMAAIKGEQLSTAGKMVNYLTASIQMIWRTIVHKIQHSQFEKLLTFLWEKKIHHPELFFWVSQHHVQLQSFKQADLLLTHLDYHYQQYRTASGEDAKLTSAMSPDDEKMRLCSSHYVVFSQCFLRRQQLLLAKQKYPELIQACQTYLAHSNPQTKNYFDRRNYLETLLLELADRKSYKHIPEIVEILAASQEIYAGPFDQVLEILLKNDALKCIHHLLKYFPLGYQDH